MKNKIIRNIYLVYEGIFLILIELFNQLLIKKTLPIQLDTLLISSLFDIVLVLLFFYLLKMIKPKIKKNLLLVVNIILVVISLANYFIYSYFGLIFSWKDIFLTGEGFSFINSVFEFINIKLIFFLFIAILLIIIIFRSVKKEHFYMNMKRIIITLIGIIILIVARYMIQKSYLSNESDGWNSFEVSSNYSNNYIEWIDSPKLLRICGMYEYQIRDFYFSFIKKNNIVSAKKEVDKYLEKHDNIDTNNEYTGIFKDKNLIFIMMEALDDWLVNENVTPTMYEMMQHGFNFNNHYSPVYVTGATANTEFIANSGMYPNINKLSPNYAFVNNSFPYSIANLFKDNDYIVNSYHRSSGYIYNRDNMHLSLGYSKYNNYIDLEIAEENINLDSYLIKNGYNKIINDDKFMSFIITYSPHSPYNYQKEECTTHLEDIKKIYPDETDEEILCAYSSARETDEMFRILLEKLEADNLLDDTIIAAFSDHPNKVLIRDDETEKLNKTIFFIYDNNMDSNQIDNITSSINILPTIINLFGIETNYIYPGYDALSNTKGYVIFDDYTYYDGSKIKNITSKMYDDINYSINLLVSDYYNNN